MAITLAQSKVTGGAFSGSSTKALAYASAVTAGNTLVATVSGDSTQTITSVADDVNAGNWTNAVERAGNGSLRAALFYKTNTGSGTPTVTITLSGVTNGFQITIWEIQGASTPQLDQTNNNTGTTGVSDAGSLATTLANSIIIAATCNANLDSTIGTSYTLVDSENGFQKDTAQYRIVSSTSTYSTAFGTDTGGNWSAVAANFGEAAAASIPNKIVMVKQAVNRAGRY